MNFLSSWRLESQLLRAIKIENQYPTGILTPPTDTNTGKETAAYFPSSLSVISIFSFLISNRINE